MTGSLTCFDLLSAMPSARSLGDTSLGRKKFPGLTLKVYCWRGQRAVERLKVASCRIESKSSIRPKPLESSSSVSGPTSLAQRSVGGKRPSSDTMITAPTGPPREVLIWLPCCAEHPILKLALRVKLAL